MPPGPRAELKGVVSGCDTCHHRVPLFPVAAPLLADAVDVARLLASVSTLDRRGRRTVRVRGRWCGVCHRAMPVKARAPCAALCRLAMEVLATQPLRFTSPGASGTATARLFDPSAWKGRRTVALFFRGRGKGGCLSPHGAVAARCGEEMAVLAGQLPVLLLTMARVHVLWRPWRGGCVIEGTAMLINNWHQQYEFFDGRKQRARGAGHGRVRVHEDRRVVERRRCCGLPACGRTVRKQMKLAARP